MKGAGSVTVELSADFFKCPVCLMPFRPPIYQCKSGHSLCSLCRMMSSRDCRTCGKATVYKHNKVLESIVAQTKFRCVNYEYGCKKLSSCHQKPNHEKECLYLPVCCPESDCDFRGSKDMLPGHLTVIHEHIINKFHYDQSFRVCLSGDSKMKLLVADDGTVFLLQNQKEAFGQIVSVFCIRCPGLNEPSFLCDLKITKYTNITLECDLMFRCPVPSTRLENGPEKNKNEYFLFVPVKFCSGPYRLINVDVCIKIQAVNK